MANVQFANPVGDFYSAANQGQNRQLLQLRLLAAQRAAEQYASQQRARAMAGQVLQQLAVPPGAQPTSPGQPSQPKPKAPAGPAPFAPMPSGAAPQGAPSAPGAIPPPPNGGASPAAPAAAPAPQSMNLSDLVQALKRNGVSDDHALDVLDQLAPIMGAENKQQLADMKAELAAQRAATGAYKAELQAHRDAATERYRRQMEKDRHDRNQIARDRLNATLGKSGKIQKWDTDADGNVVGGWDRQGNYHTVTQPPGGPSNPKAGANLVRGTAALQRELNALQLNTSPTPAQTARIQQLEQEIQSRNQQLVSPTGKPAPGGDQIPAAARAQLKEGVNTTFGNGQVWTLRNGKPTRVR